MEFDKFDNKTILIIGLIAIALVGMICGTKDIPLAVASGLTGYLSKDAITYVQEALTKDDTDDL